MMRVMRYQDIAGRTAPVGPSELLLLRETYGDARAACDPRNTQGERDSAWLPEAVLFDDARRMVEESEKQLAQDGPGRDLRTVLDELRTKHFGPGQ